MPVNEIIQTKEARASESPVETTGSAPEDDNAPDGDPAPTSMAIEDPMLPPYIHNQTLDDRGALLMAGTVLGLLSWVHRLED